MLTNNTRKLAEDSKRRCINKYPVKLQLLLVVCQEYAKITLQQDCPSIHCTWHASFRAVIFHKVVQRQV